MTAHILNMIATPLENCPDKITDPAGSCNPAGSEAGIWFVFYQLIQ